MNNTPLVLVLLALPALLVSTVPTAGAHVPCDPTAPTTVTTNPVTLTVPVPGSVGPVTVPAQTVGGQTVGGQTVGPVTLPTIATIGGVPVVGTVTIGGQVVGPITVPQHTLPQETVGPLTVGPVPTGLQPVVVTVHSQRVDVPASTSCASATASELNADQRNYVNCVRSDFLNDPVNGDLGALIFCLDEFLA